MKQRTLILFIACLCGFVLAAGETYNFYFIADPHLGPASSYDMSDSNPFRTKKDIRRGDKTAVFFDDMMKDIAVKKDANSKFIISGGDLIEGGTGGKDVHAKTLQDAMDRVSGLTGLPLHITNGNHDDWGQGGPEAFREVAFANAGKRGITKFNEPGLNYTFTQGPDLFIFVDFHTEGSEHITKMMEALKGVKPGQYRYVFIVTHSPFFCGGKTSLGIVEKLAAYNAIVLCGHSHQTFLLRFQSEKGRASQFMNAAFISSRKGYRDERFGVETYWKQRIGQRKTEAGKKQTAEQRKLWDGKLVDYWEVRGWGYSRLEVSDDGVKVVTQSVKLDEPPIVKTLL